MGSRLASRLQPACMAALCVVASLMLAGCGGGSGGQPGSGAEPPTGVAPSPAPPDAPPVEEEMPPPPPVRLFQSGFEEPVSVMSTNRRGTVVQRLLGGDVPPFDWSDSLWGESGPDAIGVHSIVGNLTPLPANAYSRPEIRTVTGRSGEPTRALALANVSLSPATSVQQIAVRRIGMTVEPVFYQRMWVKFDVGTLDRAVEVGEREFYQIFWEIKADPDYRIRLQLQYDEEVGLIWQVQGDSLESSVPFWSAILTDVPVTLADEASADGWHKVEVWMDRPGGRFKAAIDGRILVDRAGSLMGASRNPIDLLLTMIVYSDVAPLAEVLFDDVEFWSAPPEDAWQ